MDMNADARTHMNRWRNRAKTALRRSINFEERVNLYLDAIRKRMVTNQVPLREWSIKQVYYRDVGQYDPIDEDWRIITVGDTWGGKNVSAFFRREVSIPQEMDGQTVYLRIYVEGDSLLKLDGVPYHGLDPYRDTVLLLKNAVGGSTHLIELESYVFWYPAEDLVNTFSEAALVTIDAEIEAVYWDFVAAFKVLFIEDIDTKLAAFIKENLWNALLAIPIHEPDFAAFKNKLLEIRADFRKTVFETDRFKATGLLHLVGHSHLDIVYQWPHREYIRKVGRTHATMLRLMERYPDFKFSQSSPKIYADMKEHYPEMFEEVKQRIKDGHWQAVGAFWLEPDCNLISGESFVRHILHGQRFWQEEFGFTSRVCWQPDVFGMSWALPQILKRSGIDIALTNKPFVWNDTNPWRQNTFWWQGPDGSKILGVIPPGHFIGMVDPDHMDKYWRDFSDKETVSEMIYIYGWGDGGGGVDPEMLECATRYQDFPGLVPTKFNHPEDTLLSIAENAGKTELPIWDDEIYLEAHRGTFTSKGRLKKLNRHSEILCRQVEILASLVWLNGHDYPEQDLDTVWKILLGTQFHDALPGTHINEVYHWLLGEYQSLQNIAEQVQNTASSALFGDNDGDNVMVFNPTLKEQQGIIELPADVLNHQYLADESGTAFLQQLAHNLDGSQSILVDIDSRLPPIGYRVFRTCEEDTKTNEVRVSAEKNILENRLLRAEFADNGEIISLWDKEAEREVLAEGQHGNKFQIYDDRPGRFDAWDIVESYVEHELPIVGETSLTVDETGPLRASLKLVRHCYESTITQCISLMADSRELTFETEINWQERQRLLKVGFPIDVNARLATYDIAYGTIERPTHRNTSHDAARFEVPAHWWMDMSDNGYGVALLNDCKYGHEAHSHWMRLTLLKGSISPDPEADREVHHFTYRLYPHIGGWRESDVIGAATKLNQALYSRQTEQDCSEYSFARCDAPNVTLEAIKRSENGEYLILRLVEKHNVLTRATLTFDREFLAAHTCDLMENIEQNLTFEGQQLKIELRPREIVTLAIK